MKYTTSFYAFVSLILTLSSVSMQAQAPSADIGLPVNADLCAPSTITFTNPTNVTTGNPAGTTYTYIVITGCEPPDTTVIPHTTPFTPFTYTFQRSSCDPGCATPQPGNFQVIMQASNASGSATDTLNVPIASNGTLGFSAPLTANANELVCLTDTSAKGYYWNPTTQTCGDNTYWGIMPGTVTMVSGTLGNQTTPGSAVPCMRFNQSGTYMVALIRPAGACPSDTLKKTITVKPPCDSLAHFTWSTQCNSVQFTPVYPEPGATYNWTFGDGGISNEVNPSHIYFTQVDSQQYMVRLIIVSGSCIDTFTATVDITIIAGGLPGASMQSLGVGITLIEPFLHCNGSNINPDYNLRVINNSSNTDTNSKYTIIWGDGSSDSMPNPFGIENHNYNSIGLYNIILIVENSNGCVDTANYPFFHGRIPVTGFGPSQSVDLCAPVTIEFDYTDAVINFNPPSTIYTYIIETGCLPTDTIVIPHTTPFTPLSYTFTRGSCEPGCGNDGNFLVKMIASNGCGTKDQDYEPNISKIGSTDFDMPLLSCTDSTVCIFNTSDTSYYYTSSENCSTEMYSFWKVSPPTGFTLAPGGVLGILDDGVLGTDTICLKFNIPGEYQVSMVRRPLPTLISSPCPYDTITKTICVVPQPNANFTFQQPQPACAPNNSTITFTNTSNTLGNCRQAQYTWDVRFIESDCGSEGGYTFLNNTGPNSINPIIHFDSSGRYEIHLIVENDCGIDSTVQEVIFGGTPYTVIAPIDNACGSLIVKPMAETVSGCNGATPVLQWTAQGTTYPLGTTPPNLTYNIPGTYTIQVQTSGGCGTSISTTSFTVYPIPAPPVIISNAPLCQGQTLSINVQDPEPGFEYEWTTPCDPPSVNGSSVIIPSADPACTGIYGLTITDPSSDLRCSLMVTTTALVYDAPPITLLSDTVRICSGQSGTIQVTNIQPGYTYAWSSPNSPTITTGPVVVVPPTTVTVQTTLTYTVTVTDALGCTNTAMAVVIVNPLPVLSIVPPGTACVGVQLPLNAITPPQGSIVWSVSPAGPTITPINQNPANFVSDSLGIFNIGYVFTDNNGCIDSADVNICVQPQPNASFTVNTAAGCLPLAVTTTNNSNTLNTCGNTTYGWQVIFDGAECHNGTGMWNFVQGSNAASISPAFNFTQSGVYRLVLTVTNNCGTSSSTTTITVGEAPQGLTIDPIANVCDTLFLAPTGQAQACNAPGLTLTWYLDGDLFPNPPGIGFGIDGPHIVEMVATNVCGADTLPTNFTIYPLPPVPVVTYNGPVCERSTLTFTVSSPTGPNLEYCWTRPGGLPDICMTDSVFNIPTATPLNAGLYTLTVRNLSTLPVCENSTSITAVVNPAPPIILQADTVRICSGQSGTIQVTNIQSGYTYAWSPSDSLNTTTGPVVVVTPATVVIQTTLTYTVTVTDTLGCTNTATAVVIVNPLPVLSIVPPGTACLGVQLPLNAITPPQGSIVWSVSPAGPTITPINQNPANFVSDSLGIFNIGYVFTDNNGCIDSADVNICVQPQPNASFTVNTAAGCLPLAVTTTNNSNTLNTCGNTTYGWQVIFDGAECHNGTGMWNFVQGSNAASISPAFNFTQSGVYRLVLTVTNNCGTSSSTTTITVGEAPQGLMIAPIANTCDTLFLAPTGQAQACNASGLTLTWCLDDIPFPNPPGIGVGTDGLHTVKLVATNVCGAATLSTNFTIHPLPPVPVVTYNGPVCERSTLTFTVSSPTGPNLEYCWTRPGGLPDICMTDSVFNIPNATLANTGLYTLTVRNLSTLPVCENSTSITAVVNPAPPIILQADTVRICSGQSGTIQVTNIQSGYTYAWSPSDSLNTTTGPVVVVTPATVVIQTTLTYTVTVTDTLGCTNTATAVVIVNPLPVLSIVPPGTACLGVQLPLNAITPPQGSIVWSVSPAGPTITPINQNPANFVSDSLGIFNIGYVFTDNNGCIDSADVNICVQPQPNASFTVNTAAGCLPLAVTTTNNSNTLNTCGNTTYGWQVIFDGAECHNGTGMWNFVQGSNAASISPAFNFTQSGVYRLVLTVTNNCGTSSSTTTITVGEAPQGLTIDPIANVCDTLFLAPTGQAQACNAPGLTLTWYLDGDLFPNPPGIGFGIDGPHIVEMVATNVCGADTLPTNFTIYPLPPVPVVTYNGPVCERSTLTFTVSSPTGPNLEYCWTRPGGLPDICMTDSVFNIPTATPLNAGLYTLTVRNLSTLPVCENSTSITAVVNPAPPIILQADTVRICSGQSGTIQVTNIQSGYTYAWSPSDSLNTTTGPVVVVTPATVVIQTTLTYTVTVTDTLGCTNTATAVVIVNPLPVLSIVPPGTACLGVQLPLNAITPPQGSIVWSVSPAGPTITPINQNPANFVSDSLGIFNIGYVFTDNNGCIDSADVNICVQPQPNASFTVNTAAGCLPLAVTTTNNSNTLNTCGNTTYGWQVIFDGAECHNGTGMWNFVQGSNAASISPAFNFTQSGVYRLVLTVTNNCGTSSSTTTITVGEAPQGLMIAPIANTCDTLFLAPTGQAQACNASGLTLTWYLDGVLFPNPPGIGVGIDGLHTVELVATNVCGADTLPTNFTIHPLPPVPVVTYNGPVCERSTLTFTVSSPTGPNLEYCWTRPGGLPDTCMTNPVFNIPNATPANAGLYTLTVRNLSTLPVCENSTSITAVVNPAPPIILQADTVRICSEQSGTIQVINIQPGYTYAWSPSDSLNTTTGPVVVVTPATVTVQTTLTYTVTVTDALTCTNTATAVVIVNPLPVLSIVPPGTACEGEPLPLSANVSVQGIGIWSSNPTGPTFTPTNQNPTVFNSSIPGVFNVEYTLTDNNGCVNSADIDIQVRPLPMITTSVIPSGNCVPVTISLTNQPAAGITYTWNFGDGSVPVISTNPGTYTYSVPGIYTITMTAADAFGCSRTINFSPIQVNPVPTSGFVLPSTATCAIPQTLCLNDASSGATIYNWTSTPSVGAIASVNSPCITINAEGTYSIKQEVRNQFGCVDSTTLSYTAYDAPIAAFSVSGDTSGCENLAILFDNQSEHADFWIWRFDGLVDSVNLSPSHVFDDPGQYTISLTVGNGSGCTDTRTRTSYIEVYPKPVANFDYLLLANEWPFTFQFWDKSTTDATLFGWNFGENSGIDSEERNPKYRYLSASNRVITHWVENTFGCVDTTSLPLSIDLTGDLFVPNILEPLNQDHPEKQVFLPKGYNLSKYHIAVFARTGQLIWESTQLDTDGQPVESWDGTLNGEPLPGGVFVWKVLEAKFIDGRDWNGMLDENKTKRKSNFLYLIR